MGERPQKLFRLFGSTIAMFLTLMMCPPPALAPLDGIYVSGSTRSTMIW